MLIHCVFLQFRPDVPQSGIAQVMADLAGLAPHVPGMLSFVAGPNRDFEGKSAAFTHGFVITFADRAALAAYGAHPDHQRAGAWLVASCTGGHEGITVFDLET